jgi:hypothetical protein
MLSPSCPACYYCLSHYGCPLLAVLFWLSCSDCSVLAALFWLSCSGCCDLAVQLRLFCSGCPVLVVLFWLSFSCYHVLALPSSGHPDLAVQVSQRNSVKEVGENSAESSQKNSGNKKKFHLPRGEGEGVRTSAMDNPLVLTIWEALAKDSGEVAEDNGFQWNSHFSGK